MDVKSKKAEQGDQTRAALLEAAKKLFSTKGYADTPLDELVRQAGVTKGALYHHFRDKPALFEAVVAEMVASLGKTAQRLSKQRMAQEGGPRRGMERLAAAFEIFLDQLGDPATHRILLVDGPAVLGGERFDQLWVENSLIAVRRILGRFPWSPGVPDPIREPLARMLLGGVQEAALAIAHADDPAATRNGFVGASLWLVQAVHEKAARDVDAEG